MGRWVVMWMTMSLAMYLTGCATTGAGDWTRFYDGSVKQWLDQEAIPGLSKTLSEHPRFKNETIRIAALNNQQVAESSNGLTTAIRDALYSALLQQPGLNIVRSEGPESCPVTPVNGYYLAIDTSSSGNRGGTVQLRLFDIVEQKWISGIAYQWRGELSQSQREALRRTVVAESARGLRALPFTADQSDLLAQRLAADLACHLKHRGDDELIVQPARDRGAALVAGNLASKHRIPVATAGELELETRVHQVDDKLYQVWALLTPANAPDDVSAIATSAYATHPLLKPRSATKRPITSAAAAVIVPAVAGKKPPVQTKLLSTLRVIGVARDADCGSHSWQHRSHDLGKRPVITADSCFGLQFERDRQSQVYVISHQVDAGLQRLYPASCTRNALDSKTAVARFPQHRYPLQWDARAGNQTLYVIAARGARANAKLERLLSELPDGCSSANKSRLASTHWLDNIDNVVRTFGKDVAWEAVRIHHQPKATKPRLSETTGARR